MGYCFDHGIPWEEYLERWGPEDRAKVAAVALERSDVCQSCGTAGHVWEEDPHAYVPVLHTCPGCRLRELMNEDDTPKGKGVSVRLVTKAAAERMEAERERRAAEGTLRPRLRR